MANSRPGPKPGPDPYDALDAALTRMRRFWDHPVLLSHLRALLGTNAATAPRLRAARAVERLGGQSDVKGIAGELRIDASTASRHAEQAVSAGYLIKGADPNDGRRCVLTLTPEGRKAMTRVHDARVTLLGELSAGWKRGELERFVRTAEALLAACDALLPVEES
ncbi:MarR family winged helix-turn-helix transcriptional regulator [Haliangium ochraceum]|uniref:Transcriptional regulator, MarR family n=1 Tax=Haliangium ochraceum (strain DSM 14365 / JCM 11303 / SMP-2) TaxID=502025 RepID=D0LNK2_HALO1|nr:MarR family winged helix-turn-helix transcriptional regulator [Haliangium ochraceum]ACY16907.1 transcriptional regulator, MarR family [Haliangium ochraceum DSM 14365]